VITYYLLVGGSCALAVGFLAPQVIHLLGRQNFAISPAVVLLLCGANVAGGLMYPVTIGPYICEKTGRMVPVFLCSMLMSVVAGWVFVKAGGLMGAAAALLVVYLIQGLLLGYVSNGLYPIKIEWARIARVLIVLAAAYWCTRSVLGSAGAWWSPGLLLAVLTVGALVVGLVPVRRLRLGRNWS
jgi:O-antigen/teichoic acid export membrane protein